MAISLPASGADVIRANGSVDPGGLERCLGLRPIELSSAIGVSASTIGRGANSPRAQEKMRRIYALFVRTARLFKGNEDHARIWLHAPNPDLDFKRPVAYLIDGRLDVLDAFLDSVTEGTP
jgi:uncharacterized protein (DUF2384 family)